LSRMCTFLIQMRSEISENENKKYFIWNIQRIGLFDATLCESCTF
jgi:hypothetical protein